MTEAYAQITGTVASVAVDKTLFYYDFIYDYLVPDSLVEQVTAGKRVVVPFGKGNKKTVALVFSVMKKNYDPTKIKPLISVLDKNVIMSDEMLKLVIWMKENTFCTYFDAIKTAIPAGLSFTVSAQYELTESSEKLNDSESAYLQQLKMAKNSRELDFMICGEKQPLTTSLIKKGYILKVETANRKIGDEIEKMYRLSPDFETNDRIAKLSAKQKSVIEALIDTETASMKELCYICNVTSVVVKNLVKYGLLEEFTFEISRSVTASAEANKNAEDIVLSQSQHKVFEGIYELLTEDKPRCALLYGVTGSGKTSVFVTLINETLKLGKTAIMLVPEISLTPQTVNFFQSIFGNKVAILHSGLSIGQRADEYKRIDNGDARIVIGTRSAVFAPVKNIGIIVIDEEGEHTYKSEKSPRYHARNIAKQRVFLNNALLLLASATPSIDSFYNAKIGRYNLFTLSERYKNAVLPEVYLVDMKIENENGNRGNFSEALLYEIGENLKRGEQSLLLLNRRGYNTFANCIACGAVIECPNCNIPMTYHKVNETMACHYCGYTISMPKKCPKCGSVYLHQSGTGTQRIEDEIMQYFPTARVLRMDADTTMTKDAFSKKFSQFGNGDYDIMVGTQMIAKGLDFENVTLVGVLLIDKSLYAGDYMGYERTFSLITQVVGRSGRGSKKGRAYLQTFTPEHYVLQLAAHQNYDEFYAQEIEVRKALLFPPFCDIAMAGFSSLIENACVSAANEFIKLLLERIKKEENEPPTRILGPSKSGTGRLGGKFRYKLVIKCKMNKQFREIMNDVLMSAYKNKAFTNVSFFVDINGEIF